MKKLGFLLVACALFASANKSYAYDDSSYNNNLGVYIGLGGGFTFGNLNTYSKDVEGDDKKAQHLNSVKLTHNANVVLGYNIIPYLAVEAEYAYGFAQNLDINPDVSDAGKHDFSSHLFFANVVGKYEFVEGNSVFVKAGVGYALYRNIEPKVDAVAAKGDGSGKDAENTKAVAAQDEFTYKLSGFTFQAGAGYEFAFDANNSLSLAYMFKMSTSLSVSDASDASDADKAKVSTFKKTYADSISKAGASSVQIAYKFTF